MTKRKRVDKPYCGGEWSRARFFSFIRSGLRQISRRWAPIARLALHDARRPYKGPNKRQKWEYQCAECGGWFMGKEVQVDHIVPCGSLRSFEDIGPFCERLFVEKEGLQVLCKANCHQSKTHGKKK